MRHLRHITVWVDEPEPGHFHWVLHESTEDASVWVDLVSSKQPYETWSAAFEDGRVELFKLARDERIGPRMHTAWEQEIFRLQPRLHDLLLHSFACDRRDLELHRALRLVLHNDCARCH
jgi:hypothetical protein